MSGRRSKLIRKATREALAPKMVGLSGKVRKQLFHRAYRWAKKDWVGHSH